MGVKDERWFRMVGNSDKPMWQLFRFQRDRSFVSSLDL